MVGGCWFIGGFEVSFGVIVCDATCGLGLSLLCWFLYVLLRLIEWFSGGL